VTPVITRTVDETVEAGRSFAAVLRPGDIVALTGDLGAGKTHFVTGVCAGLRAEGHIASPTFTLIHEYHALECIVIHADMYRINSVREAFDLGLAEYFQPPYVTLIEWADRILDLLPQEHYLVELRHGAGHGERIIAINRPGETCA
jgi:tRNA threonylcarbamoyladenosine biosynthesis protein TsaE